MQEKIKNYFLYFMMYSIIGWCYEVFLEVVIYKWGFTNRGVLFGPYCPVYGVGALLFVFTVYKLLNNKDIKNKILMIPLVFILCMLISTSLELLTSYICEFFTGAWPWQTYANYKVNFQARIALSPSIRFGLGGCIFLYFFQPIFEIMVNKLGKIKNYVVYSLLIVFLIDIVNKILF